MASPDTPLSLAPRTPDGSRSARRLRRDGLVPGVLYGIGQAPEHFAVDARILRNTLAHAHAVLQISLGGAAPAPVVVQDLQRHPVRGDVVHVDLRRVDMRRSIHATVELELTGADAAPGVVEGGVLTQETREVAIEALPGDIPDSIVHDVSGLEMNATLTLSAVRVPPGVTFLDDPEETVVATITPPSAEPAGDEIERETEVIGDAAVDSAQAQAQAAGDTAQEAAQKADAD